jgi:hypothetical protein
MRCAMCAGGGCDVLSVADLDLVGDRPVRHEGGFVSGEWDDQLGDVERGTAGVSADAQVQDLAAELRWLDRMEAPERRAARIARRGTARNLAAALRRLPELSVETTYGVDPLPSTLSGWQPRTVHLTINGPGVDLQLEPQMARPAPPPLSRVAMATMATEALCNATVKVLGAVPDAILRGLGLRRARGGGDE